MKVKNASIAVFYKTGFFLMVCKGKVLVSKDDGWMAMGSGQNKVTIILRQNSRATKRDMVMVTGFPYVEEK